MIPLEHLARTMCVSLNLNPDELVTPPQSTFDLPKHPDNGFVDKRVPQWTLFINSSLSVLATIRQLVHPLGVDKEKIRVWNSLIDQIRVSWEDVVLIPSIIPVLQDWVNEISRRQQGVMVLALRGPDGMHKEHPSKNAIRSLRACVMNSGREGTPMVLGQRYETDSFMRMDLIADRDIWDKQCVKPFLSCVDEYNIHFFQHLLHAAAVVGFNHPLEIVRENWLEFYNKGCGALHMNPETREQFTYRLRDGIREGE